MLNLARESAGTEPMQAHTPQSDSDLRGTVSMIAHR